MYKMEIGSEGRIWTYDLRIMIPQFIPSSTFFTVLSSYFWTPCISTKVLILFLKLLVPRLNY